MSAAGVRDGLVRRLRRNLIGPSDPDDADLAAERLPAGESPSRWYLTGFIAPSGELTAAAAPMEAAEDDEGELFLPEVDGFGAGGAAGDHDDPEPPPTRRRFLPSAIGLSTMVDPGVATLEVTVDWGDYVPEPPLPPEVLESGVEPRGELVTWRRVPRTATLTLVIPAEGDGLVKTLVPASAATARPGGALELGIRARPFRLALATGAVREVRVVTVFLVNKRREPSSRFRDLAYAYQVRIGLHCPQGFVAQHDLSRITRDDWDEQLADLHYRDAAAYAVGLGCATGHAVAGDGIVRHVHTTHLPRAAVERTVTAPVAGVEFAMDRLALLADGAAVHAALDPLVAAYADWAAGQRQAATAPDIADAPQRARTAATLIEGQATACDRIAAGIELLATDARARTAFAIAIANRAVADAGRARRPGDHAPAWRPFQLAFILLNLAGMADRTHPDREIADLLFFPTGGGKTEAYLGLAAFTIALRRLGADGLLGAGVSVVMCYTLRLLTLDQLGRAAGMVCALELLRTGPDYRGADGRPLLGDWRIEIGLWVGSDASPNWLGGKGDRRDDTAVKRVRAYRSGRDPRAPAPIKACPWCGTAFTAQSFQCVPNSDAPTNLEIRCASPACAFTGDRALPIVTVDEAIYRRLPAFLIATVDKFASLPWRGQAGAFFGHVDRADATGFYGAAEPGAGRAIDGGDGTARLDPPDLVIQDELHLISGPLGTVAALYEAAIDRLARRTVGGVRIRPKIVASTATVRRAQGQIRALFDRHETHIFPAPGLDRRDSFFARTRAEGPDDPARWYLGLAAAGRGPKLVFLQALVTLLSGAEGCAEQAGGDADAYLTALCYFNALRELGGARRIVEDEVATRARTYGTERRRLEPPDHPFADRVIGEPVELTSRVSTDQVAAAKRRLETVFADAGGEPVDVALATNMISVGLDIDRLGLMLVQGQPKTAAEYIQATSRVGRNPARPGLVVVVLNVHRPRDRMHFEQFGHFHDTFYRAVEATSATPWSARALDRALPAVIVAIVRHLDPALTPSDAVAALAGSPQTRDAVVRHLVDRAGRWARRWRAPGTSNDHRKGHVMSSSHRVTLRASQVVTAFGPGSMVDLPTRSVVIGGLDLWHMREKDSWQPVHEPRAVQVLEALLRATGRLDDGTALSLRTPPVDAEGQQGPGRPGRIPPGVEARIFPTWFVARDAEPAGTADAGQARRRRLVRWRDLDPRGRADFIGDDGRRQSVTPIRFVAGCKKGHLQDIDWGYAVHSGTTERCGQPLWLEERGTSGDPRSTRIVCACGAALSLHDAQATGRFGDCRGKRPWLPTPEPGGCSEKLKFLTRTATNGYFPQVLTVISLPAAEDELSRLIEHHIDALNWVESERDCTAARRSNPALRAALEGWSDAEVLARIGQLRHAEYQAVERAPKVAEFDLLASGLDEIGTDSADAKLHARTLPRADWDGDRPRLAPIASVVAVHRLREVSCLYGFTRFEAAPTAIDGDLEELTIAVEGAALATDLQWLPAVEQRGEGIFLRFDAAALAAWAARPAVAARGDALYRGWNRWRDGQDYADRLRFPNIGCYAIHGFSHALMNEIALECGYPATALKERLYAILDDGEPRFGLLIYTASTGAQGTLGGLLAVLPRLGALAERALAALALCSGDPICAEHDPDDHADERALSGAACHSCLLVAETSCEARNLYLDRALVSATISTPGTALFTG